MTKTQERKQAIRRFLRTEVWNTEKLCQLLAHAESKLAYISCCCLVGIPTADHALMGRNDGYYYEKHYTKAKSLPLGALAERYYAKLPEPYKPDGVYIEEWLISAEADVVRRRILRPIIRAEIRRRERLKSALVLESNSTSNSKEPIYEYAH